MQSQHYKILPLEHIHTSNSTLELSRYESKKSIFLSVAIPQDAFTERLALLRSTHPKARHIVYAWRAMIEGSLQESSSDDGEPKGSSGASVLHVLRGAQMVDCAVIVVRYFGGVLLGVGGLVRAYTQATKLALEACHIHGQIAPYTTNSSQSLLIAYQHLRAFHHLRKKLGVRYYEEGFSHKGVRICVEGEEGHIATLKRYALPY